jgi:creatinine amidohydrolase
VTGRAGYARDGSSRQLGELAWPAVAKHTRSVLAVPIGSTEQHGPHLPLSTDTDIALALCAGLTDRCAGVVVAPALAYGSSGEHAGFPGTLSIGQEALELVVVELGRSATETFDRVLFVSAHGGNAVPLRRAVARLQRESRDVRLYEPRWDGDAHAGRVETSLQLWLRPDLVRAELAERGDVRPMAALLPALQAGGVRAVSPNGVLGDPAGADGVEGAELFDRLVDDLVHLVGAWTGS